MSNVELSVETAADRLLVAVEGELDGLAITHEQARNILNYVLAGDLTRDSVFKLAAPESGILWVNVYQHEFGTDGFVYETKEDADVSAAKDRIACVEMNWTEGEGI